MSEKIIERKSSEVFRDNYQRYAVYITFRRVTPDYKDGLKPVQRRVLWAMYNDTRAINKTVKSAGVVGDTMKYYHPHGDAAIYGTMQPMANWFASYLPTIQPKGNFGNFDGSPAAHYRYTEAKISDFAMDCIFADIKDSKEAVDWTPNYDNTCMEPEYLPCSVPLLLINGSFGIGLGKKIEIPTHNTNEVIDATLTLMDNPNAEITIIPDHCMHCEIINTNFKEICRTGYGYYRVRGIISTEDYKGKTALVIKSVPNMVFLDQITDKIEKLVEEKKIIQIQACYDESTGRDMRYVIVLKPGADPEYVKNVIYSNTELEHSERINFEVLDGLTPLRMSYKSYLLSFIDHRRITKFRVLANKLQYVQTKIHEKQAYIAVMQSGEIDYIINYIKKMKSVDDTALIEYLIKKCNITDLQAKFIINSNLKNLSIAYLNKYIAEEKELQEQRAYIMDIMMDDKKIDNIIKNELLTAKQKYGHPRNCNVVRVASSDDVPHGMMTVIVTEKNFIKKVPTGTPIGNFKGDNIRTIIQDDNAENILIFDNMGKVFKLPIHKIPFTDKNANGTDVRFLVKGLTANINTIVPETAIKKCADKDMAYKSYLCCLTHNGLIKKMIIDDFTSVPPSGIFYTRLEEGDYVVAIRVITDNDIAVVFSDRKAMSMPATHIPLMKRNSKGNKTFRTDGADGMFLVDKAQNYLFIITDSGKVNKLPINGIPAIYTPKKSFPVIKLRTGDKIQNILTVNDGDNVEVLTMNGKYNIFVDTIPTGSSISTGEKSGIPMKNNKIIRSYKLFN